MSSLVPLATYAGLGQAVVTSKEMKTDHESESTIPPIKDDNSLRNKEGQNIGNSNSSSPDECDTAKVEEATKEGGQSDALKKIQESEDATRPTNKKSE